MIWPKKSGSGAPDSGNGGRLKGLKRTAVALRNAWTIAGLSLLLLLLVEAAFRIWGCLSLLFIPSAADKIAESDACRDNPSLAKACCREYEESLPVHWSPYVYWKRFPYQGEFINVGTDGTRRTPQPKALGGKPLKVFFFGGSTMWGSGVDDKHAVPALVAELLAEEGIAIEAVNFGESGYVSTQELMALLLQLQAGNMPDLAVFYDGVNDVFSAWQQGTAGIPENEFNRAREFNILQSKGRLAEAFLSSSLMSVRAMRELFPRRDNKEQGQREDSRLPEKVVDVYLANMRLAKALSKEYGFKTLFLWQPNIFQKRFLSPSEKAAMEAQGDSLREFSLKVDEAIERQAASLPADCRLVNLSGLFASIDRAIFIDGCHLSGEGNKIVAKRVSKLLSKLASGKREE